ncbi:MAG: hypothetical protein DCF29_11725, partial [Alphaproteobacteria bacterium]
PYGDNPPAGTDEGLYEEPSTPPAQGNQETPRRDPAVVRPTAPQPQPQPQPQRPEQPQPERRNEPLFF